MLLGAIGAAAAGIYLYRQVDETIRRRVEALFAEHYPGLKVTVRSAELLKGEGIVVRGLSIVEPGAEGPRAELVYFDEVRLACTTELQELITKNPQATEVVIRRPRLWITRRPDGTWSASKLLPWPKFGTHLPAVKIEDGTIEIFDPVKTPASTLTLREVNLTLILPRPEEVSAQDPQLRKLQGTLSGDHFRQMVVEGLVDPHRPQWTISGSVEGLEISPELRDALPDPLAAKLCRLASLRAQGELGFRVSYDPSAVSPYQFSVSGRVGRGRIDDPRLPHGLTDVRATIRCDNQGYVLDELAARSGQSALRLSCRQAGYDQNSPMYLQAELRQLEVNRQLLEILPESFKDLWYKYLPAGLVDADLKLAFDGQKWQPEVSVRCLNVSFVYHKFPFRLEYGKGTLELKDDRLRLNLTAQSGSQPVRLSAEVLHPMSGPCGWFEAKGDDLQLDEKLLTALPLPNQAVVRSLDPHGTCNFYLRLWRDRPEDPLRKHLVIGVNRCAIRFDKFPYSVGNIRGKLEMADGYWTFQDLEGTNGTARVTCEGSLQPTPEGSELLLRLAATDVALEEELRNALRPNMQQLWNSLRPQGTVDLVAEVRYLPAASQLSLAVRAQPQSHNTWIEPVQFPYRLEKLCGELVYRDGHVTLERLRAEHGSVKLATAGVCDFLPDGTWQLRLEDLSVDRLGLDRELIQALPARLRKVLAELNPGGPVNLRGSLDFSGSGKPSDVTRSQWNLQIGFQRGSVDCGVKLENLYGELTLVGGFDGQNMHSRGELAIDSLTYKDVQFTQVLGPLWIDDQQVLLGSWVDRPPQSAPGSDAQAQPRSARPLTANLFGGTVCADGWVMLGSVPRYRLQGSLSQGDLARCSQEALAGRQNLQGKILATVDLRGTGRTANSLGGSGTVRLRDADIYELPLMISLLKVLSIRRPDTTAFSTSDIDFRIVGNHIYFDRINFNGDVISLEGQGDMNFDSQIQLTFRALVGRAEWHLPVLHELVGGASQQIVLIHVGGTLHDPQTRPEAFPAVNQALQQLQSDLRGTPR